MGKDDCWPSIYLQNYIGAEHDYGITFFLFFGGLPTATNHWPQCAAWSRLTDLFSLFTFDGSGAWNKVSNRPQEKVGQWWNVRTELLIPFHHKKIKPKKMCFFMFFPFNSGSMVLTTAPVGNQLLWLSHKQLPQDCCGKLWIKLTIFINFYECQVMP